MRALVGKWARQVVAVLTAMAFAFVLPPVTCLGTAHGSGGRSPASTDNAARGVIQLPPLTVPPSSYLSPQARAAFLELFITASYTPTSNGDIKAVRASYDRHFGVLVARERKLYAVRITHETMNGVRTEVVVPATAVAAENRRRVLINLHGGGFMMGEGIGGEVESIPIAGIGKIKVMTVAYREGPEYKFPAASEDVAAVYRALLRDSRLPFSSPARGISR